MTRRWVLAGLFVFALLVLVLCPSAGTDWISPMALWERGSDDVLSNDGYIMHHFRVPRVLTGFLAGSALAVSGMTFQAMFRNPLATPFTLGTASGASLGAAIYILLGLNLFVLGISGISVAAFVGSFLALGMVYGLTRLKRGFSTATLLLAGIAVSFFFSSLIMFIHYVSGFTNSFRILHWMMGSINVVGYHELLNMLPLAGVGLLMLVRLSRELDLLATGDDIAASRGVAVERTKKLLFVASSLMIGAVVAFCGPIGFVGMIAPHICRLLVGPNHRYLMPATFLFGGAFLVLCDTLARSIVENVEMPVGVVTALLGGPFFIFLLLSRKRGVQL